MAEPANVAVSFTIVDLLALLDDELHGYKGAFTEAQKIRRLNKAKDAIWKILKQLKENYFVAASQSVTSTTDDYFGKLDSATREYLLPKNFGEMVFAEVLSPSGYEGLKLVRLKMTSPKFMEERFSATQAGSTNQLGAGSIHYDIIGPGTQAFGSNQQWMVLASYPPVNNLDVQLWYSRIVPNFTVPKVGTETLISLLAPYVHELVSYATKSLLQQENPNLAERWEKEWRMDLERMIPAADDKDSSSPDVVEEFSDTAIEDTTV